MYFLSLILIFCPVQRKALLTTIFLLGISIKTYSQSPDTWIFSDGTGNFIVCVLAGILLATAFQFLLTNLAVAIGISATDDVREIDFDSSSTASSDSIPMGVKVTSGIGIFLVLTMSISLFCASFIAVKLSLIPNNTIGFILGLIIWAGFLLLSLYIDTRIVSSLAGSIFTSVKNILGSGISTLGDVLSKSETQKIKTGTREAVKAIHDEIRQEYNTHGVTQKLDEYINKLRPQKIELNDIHEHLVDLIHDIEIKEKHTPADPEANKRLFVEMAEKQPNFTKKDREQLVQAYEKAREIAKGEESRADKALAVVDNLTPGDEMQGKIYRSKVVDYLKKVDKEEVHPENLKKDLNDILHNPKAAPQIIKSRLNQIDRSTIKSIVSAKNGISEAQAERFINTAEKVIENIKSTVDSALSSSPETNDHTKNYQEVDVTMDDRTTIQNWFNRMQRPELRYERIKYDINRILDDPTVAPQVLQNRLNKMDRDSLVALLSNNKSISSEQAERLVYKVEEAKDDVVRKSNEIVEKTKEKVDLLKQETLRQAEGARQTAISSAWWLFATTIVSGAASALGGMLALSV